MPPKTGISGIDFRNNLNGLNNPKGNKNTICIMVKYGETCYHHKALLTPAAVKSNKNLKGCL